MNIRAKLKIQIQSASSSLTDQTIMLSQTFMKKCRIPSGETVQLQFGSMKQEVKAVPSAHPSLLRMNVSLAGRMQIERDMELCASCQTGSRTLRLGPIIGVLVSRVHTHTPDRPFGSTTSFCKELTQACSNYGAFVFFFTPQELKEGSQAISGYTFHHGWKKKTFPVPNVVYNRLTSRKLENLQAVQHFMSEVKEKHGAGVFNEKYLNKNEVFDALNNERGLHKYLPESHMLQSYAVLKEMMSKYDSVFLKPITGSLGKGIIRVSRGNGSYICHVTREDGAKRTSFARLRQLYSRLSGKIKQRNYQIQQGLSLMSVDGSPVDFRVLVQKNDKGQWSVTSAVARIAGKQHFVSNIAKGGRLSSVNDATSNSDLEAGAKTGYSPKLRRAALEIASGIEKYVDGHFAELGVDLAIDRSGRIWLLEVNSKPSKDDNSSTSGGEKIRPSVNKTVTYARYLAKF